MPVIEIKNNKVHYKFEIHGKYSIIKGDSATGKTTLCGLIEDYEKENASIVLRTTHKLMLLPNNIEVIDKEKLKEYVIFLDESAPILKSGKYENWFQGVDAYFVFITRTLQLKNLPVSAHSVYTVHSSGKFHTLIPVDSQFQTSQLSKIDTIVTEDSRSGKQFIQEVLSFCGAPNIRVQPAGGNGKLIMTLRDCINNGETNLVVVYDVAAIGTYITDLKDFVRRASECRFFMIDWESFEHYILASSVFNSKFTLQDAGCNFESLEQFSTEKLKSMLNGYKKETLPLCFKVNGCRRCSRPCSFAFYTFTSLIYGKVHDFYATLMRLVGQKTGGTNGASRLPYRQYMDRAGQLKKQWAGVLYRVVSVDWATDTCLIEGKGLRRNAKVGVVVQKLMTGEIALSNPSALRDWKYFVKG